MCLFACQGHGGDVRGRVAHWPSMCPLGHVCVCLYVWDVCGDRDHIVLLLLLDILRGRKEWEGGEKKRGVCMVGSAFLPWVKLTKTPTTSDLKSVSV